MKTWALSLLIYALALNLSACTVVGATVGGAIGHEATHSTAGTVGGAVVGGVIGHEMGKDK